MLQICHKTKQQRIGKIQISKCKENVALAQERTRLELFNELESAIEKKNVYTVTKQMAKCRQQV